MKKVKETYPVLKMFCSFKKSRMIEKNKDRNGNDESVPEIGERYLEDAKQKHEIIEE